jgi:ribonuclease P protein component
MLPASNRMRSAPQFRETTRRGVRITAGAVVLHVLATTGDGPPRMGLTIGKSVGNSVARHRTARRIRAAFASRLAEIPEGSQWVVRALPGAAESRSLQGDVVEGIARALVKLESRG